MILLSADMLPTALITKFLTGISVTFLLVIYIHRVATRTFVTSAELSLTVGALMCFHINPLLGFGLVLIPCFDFLVLRDHR